MTANQLASLDIAARVLRNEVVESDLNDQEWALVRLASSLGHSRGSPRVVCGKIIADFRAAVGFFADVSDRDLLQWETRLPATPALPPPPEFPSAFGASH